MPYPYFFGLQCAEKSKAQYRSLVSDDSNLQSLYQGFKVRLLGNICGCMVLFLIVIQLLYKLATFTKSAAKYLNH